MKKVLLLSILLCQFTAIAQEDAWVYFNTKDNVEASINNPISILTQQAIDRKSAQGIVIDNRDVPVNESFISLIKAPETGITVFAKSKWFNAIYVRGSLDDINALVNDFEFVDSIEFADKSLNPNSRIAAPFDKFSTENTTVIFNYGNTQDQIEQINADDLHIAEYTGDGILIAVLDSGFTNVNTMAAFQRLRDNNDLLDGYDFVGRNEDVYAFTGNDHGTKVLSTMAGFIENQYVGIAPDASYYLFRTEDVSSETPVEEAYWVEAAERSDSLGVHIINTSLGYRTYQNPNYTHTNEDLDGSSTFITRGANVANEKGIVVVTSAGNSGANGVGAPADATGVLSIGAVDVDGNYASFSSQGSSFQATQKPDVSTRGEAAFVIDDTNTIINNSGTSFSSPIMAGGVALLLQALPDLSNDEIKQFIRMSASQFDTPDNFLGFGIPNLEIALNMALSVPEDTLLIANVYPNPVRNTLMVQIPENSGQAHMQVYDILGQIILKQTLTSTENTVDFSKMTSGLYIIILQSGQTQKTFKLIKS
ncbi:MAG: S8 family peptidase [Psychroserpens sp.]|uniref:S8 family peptidase n=1 Tax=Psychroserpens sp. TaxID=2020870 RepID=UPI003C790219